MFRQLRDCSNDGVPTFIQPGARVSQRPGPSAADQQRVAAYQTIQTDNPGPSSNQNVYSCQTSPANHLQTPHYPTQMTHTSPQEQYCPDQSVYQTPTSNYTEWTDAASSTRRKAARVRSCMSESAMRFRRSLFSDPGEDYLAEGHGDMVEHMVSQLHEQDHEKANSVDNDIGELFPKDKGDAIEEMVEDELLAILPDVTTSHINSPFDIFNMSSFIKQKSGGMTETPAADRQSLRQSQKSASDENPESLIRFVPQSGTPMWSSAEVRCPKPCNLLNLIEGTTQGSSNKSSNGGEMVWTEDVTDSSSDPNLQTQLFRPLKHSLRSASSSSCSRSQESVGSVREVLCKQRKTHVREKVKYSEEQIEALERAFVEDPFCPVGRKKSLARQLSLDPEDVLKWMKNARARLRYRLSREEKALVPLDTAHVANKLRGVKGLP